MARQANVAKTAKAKEVEAPPIDKQGTRDRGKRLIVPGILLLLKTEPTHGYDLLQKLTDLGIEEEKLDAGTVYRTLRGMEKEGLIESKWITEGPGPARRSYEVTPKATTEIGMWVKEVEKQKELLASFLGQLKKFA
ncbi:MAG: PadR family transcriptional regulator [Firmicutes bacterium]|nr:PadR family transcriptional regulator [Bacillota bacterium]